MHLIGYLTQPWPWWVTGPFIGLIVPILLLLGNKKLGVSSSLRHICAACFPSNISFFRYDWKKEAWNLFFVAGIAAGAFIAVNLMGDPRPPVLDARLVTDLRDHGIADFSGLMPADIFSWKGLLSVRGLLFIIVGGFLVGFGTRYAGGCTSGHAIMGLSNLQLPSLVATICFMIGGVLTAHFLVPVFLRW